MLSLLYSIIVKLTADRGHSRPQDDLTPDVRTTSERRIKTLEQELVKAEQSALEVKMVTKYRGVKFFGECLLQSSMLDSRMPVESRLTHRRT